MKILKGNSVTARALQSSGMTILNVGGTNFLRLLSNLILTRLLFPEAFGLMALTQIFIQGLQAFSDIGLNTLVIQRKQGADQAFLNVIWTLQFLRGVLLWLFTCLIAWPVAQIYDQPILVWMLPVVGSVALVNGLKPTREILANRELQIYRVVFLGLGSQVVGLILMALLAYLMQSVWALAIGSVALTALRVLAMWLFLPGETDRFAWDGKVFREVLNFGSFIFIATIATFFLNQGVQLILGGYLDAATFGILSVAITFGSLPGLITTQVARIVVLPLYRMKPPYESVQNQRNIFKARRMLVLLAMGISGVLAVTSIWLIELLYDARYALAGPLMLILTARTLVGSAILGTQEALIGSGDSKRFALLVSVQAIAHLTFIYGGITWFGLLGGLAAPLVANVSTYPLRAWLTARYAAWDPMGELGLMGIAALVSGTILWFHWSAVAPLLEM